MKPLDDIERLVGQLKYSASPEFKTVTREKMFEELTKTRTSVPHGLWHSLGRRRAVCYVGGASLVVAGLAFVISLCGLPGGNHSVALAEVLEKTESMSTVILQENREFIADGEEEPTLMGHAVKYVSANLGQVEESYDDEGNVVYTAYLLKKEKRLVLVFPAVKGYLDLALSDKLSALSDDVTPTGLVRLLTRHGYSRLGRGTFDGQEVEGFEVSSTSIQSVLAAFQEYKEISLVLLPTRGAAARVWVDVNSSLLVGVEAELETGRGLLTRFREGIVHLRAHDFQWNAEIDPHMFIPDIPAEYRRLDLETLAQ